MEANAVVNNICDALSQKGIRLQREREVIHWRIDRAIRDRISKDKRSRVQATEKPSAFAVLEDDNTSGTKHMICFRRLR